MNPPPIPDPRLPGFSDEERELARVLADSAPVGTLPAGMDARILASARAAFAPTMPSMAPRRHRRWPVALGLAASVVLATGVAWQLRPLPEPAVFRTVRVADNAPARRAQEAPSYRRAVVAPAVDAEAMRAPVTAPSGRDPLSPAAAAKAARGPVVIAPVVALPAPGPARPEAVVAADAAGPATTADIAEAAAATPAPPPPAAATDGSANRPTATSARAAAPAAVVLPPDAWIDRIRLLRDAGRLAEARADLRAMRRAHPQAPIPTDLRSLAD